MQALKHITDDEVLSGLRTGRDEMFSYIFNTYWESLFREAYYRLKSHDEAQDLVQDIFTDFWQRRKDIVVSASISAYLHGALKHRIIRHISRSRLHQHVVEHLLYQMTAFEDSIMDIIAVGEIQKTLEEAISYFPENMQQIFLLRSQDFTIKEIADTLGLSPQTVKNNSTEALKRLKQVLAEKHPDVSSTLYVFLLLFMKS
ncbi:RNA polymerase sigma factor [Sphingobacterium sp. LRF_L2]|uniref:RNA polymerase sigma factor n=1 Tax=Sphingobacterium sp. LRF_L2 TaxID=3369421 RepID=UPI003F60475B